MTRVTASLVEWKDDKGYGFARQPGGAERIFVHVKAFGDQPTRPQKGDDLEFDLVAGRDGRPAAENARVLGAKEVAQQLPYHLVTASMLFILAALVVMLGQAPFAILPAYALMGGLSLLLYSHDKQAAIFGAWRIRESTLLFVDLCGGIIGGLLAQHRYRHKKSKPSYQYRIFTIVLLHVVFLLMAGLGFLNPEAIARVFAQFAQMVGIA